MFSKPATSVAFVRTDVATPAAFAPVVGAVPCCEVQWPLRTVSREFVVLVAPFTRRFTSPAPPLSIATVSVAPLLRSSVDSEIVRLVPPPVLTVTTSVAVPFPNVVAASTCNVPAVVTFPVPGATVKFAPPTVRFAVVTSKPFCASTFPLKVTCPAPVCDSASAMVTAPPRSLISPAAVTFSSLLESWNVPVPALMLTLSLPLPMFAAPFKFVAPVTVSVPPTAVLPLPTVTVKFAPPTVKSAPVTSTPLFAFRLLAMSVAPVVIEISAVPALTLMLPVVPPA